jgi:glycosyltransferase 2 family protein
MHAPDGVEPPADAGRLRRAAIRIALGLVVVAVIVLVTPGLGEVRERFEDISPPWLVAALAFEVLSCVSYVVVFRAVFVPGYPWRRTLRLGLSEIAVTALLPVGGAGGLVLGAWVMRRRGVPGPLIARRSVAFFALTSAVNFAAAIIVGAAMGVGLLPSDGARGLSLLAAAVALAIGVLVVVLGRRVDRLPLRGRAARLATSVPEALDDVPALLRGSGWMPLAGAVGYWVFDVAALWAVLHGFGVSVPTGAVAMAHLLGMLGAILPIPGGLGGVDAGLAGALIVYGTSASGAIAAVLVFRAIVLGVALALGVPAGLALMRVETGGVSEEERRRAARAVGVADPPAGPG